MPRAICEDCGSLVEAELTHNGICAVGHYVHCGWGHEMSPDDLISDDVAEIIADLEAKLASGVIAEYDDDSTVFLSGYAGGAAIGGAWSTLTLMEKASDGTLRVREYKAQGDWRATIEEIKGESHD